MASGRRVRKISADKFAFVEGEKDKHRTDRHILVASGDILLIYESDAEVDEYMEVGDAFAVACFKAPQYIASVRCRGGSICVGCASGALCILEAPFLAA